MRVRHIWLTFLILVIGALSRPAVADPSLQGWWRLDDVNSGSAVDFSGNGNDGMFKGDPQWAAGFEGDSLEFDGIDDYLSIRNMHYDSDALEQVTVAAWIRTSDSGTQAIASFDRSEYWRLEVNGNAAGAGQIGWSVMSDVGQIDLGGSGRIDDDRWRHVAGVFDRGVTSIYIDGRLDAQTTQGSTFGTGVLRYGFIAARSEAGSFDGNTGTPNPFNGTLDEVRIYDSALSQEQIRALASRLEASNPSPADKSQLDKTEVTLAWQPGKYAATHNVYFSDDAAGLDSALVGENLPLEVDSFGPISVELGRTYYWFVEEVNDGSVWSSDVWSFDTQKYLVIDDFDSYVSVAGPGEPSLLSTWTDGSVNATGAAVTLDDEYVGSSMNLAYDNSQAPFESRAELLFDEDMDMVAGGVKALSLELSGDPNNDAGTLDIVLLDAYGTAHSVTADDSLGRRSPRTINVDLQEFAGASVDLTAIRSLAVRVGGDGSGVVTIDDIRLHPPRCLPQYALTSFDGDCTTDFDDFSRIMAYWLAADYDVLAAEPDAGRLQAHYRFDEGSGLTAGDSSANAYDAAIEPNGIDAWDAGGYDGYCLAFDGNFVVTVPEEVFASVFDEVTVAVWVHIDADVNPESVGRAEFGAGPADPNESWDRLSWVQDEPQQNTGRWCHYAFVKNAGDSVMRIYHDGVLVARNTEAALPTDGSNAGASTIGGKADGSGRFKGKLDDMRIYDYALSHAEILYLVGGDDAQLHQPLQPVLAPGDPHEDGIIDFRDMAIMGQWWLEDSLWP